MNRFKHQRGDTIVEVLIAIAIVSFVLVLAFALSSHATDTVRDSQEHSEALKLAESQLEQIKASTNGLAATYNCYASDGTGPTPTPTACKFASNGGGTCNEATNGYCYNVKVTSTTTSTPASPYNTTLYTVAVTWDRVGGGGSSKVGLDYRALSRNMAYTPPVGPSVVTPPGGGGGPPGADDSENVDVQTGDDDSPQGQACLHVTDCPDRATSFTYHYSRGFTILEMSVAPGNVAGCTWDWGDGTTTTFSSKEQCSTSAPKVSHIYPDSRTRPEGGSCIPDSFEASFSQEYTVTFKVHSKNGKDVPAIRKITFHEPHCSA